jgi:HNH endonuclease
VSSKSRQAKKAARQRAHALIFSELKRLGIKYHGMDMAEAVRLIAAAHGVQPPKWRRERAAFISALVKGNKAVMATVPTKPTNVVKFPKKPKPPPEDKIKKFYASWEWKRLSYDAKLQRGRKCECCGAQPPQVRIITDHIKPIRHHWHLRLDPSNLQVLCDECNMGKGSRDESDFREPVEMVLWED